MFGKTMQAGICPDFVTFMGVLSACGHAGLVDKGCKYFNLMSAEYGVIPGVEHFGCMVSLLGRAGFLDEAEDIINKMPVEPDPLVCGALVGGCRIHGNMELGRRVADCLLALQPQNHGTYVVLISNIFASSGMWDEAKRVTTMKIGA